LGIRHMNFLLPDITHDNRARVYNHHSSTPVADYLIPIFDEWFGEDDPDIRVSIFHELITLVRGGKARSDSFGNLRSGYVVVETDGGIHANDVLRISGHDIGNGGLNIFTHGFDDLHLGSPLLYRMVHEGIELCETFQAWPEKRACGGGHIPHRYAHRNGFDNPSAWCSDIMKMLAHIRKEVQAFVALSILVARWCCLATVSAIICSRFRPCGRSANCLTGGSLSSPCRAWPTFFCVAS